MVTTMYAFGSMIAECIRWKLVASLDEPHQLFIDVTRLPYCFTLIILLNGLSISLLYFNTRNNRLGYAALTSPSVSTILLIIYKDYT